MFETEVIYEENYLYCFVKVFLKVGLVCTYTMWTEWLVCTYTMWTEWLECTYPCLFCCFSEFDEMYVDGRLYS